MNLGLLTSDVTSGEEPRDKKTVAILNPESIS